MRKTLIILLSILLFTGCSNKIEKQYPSALAEYFEKFEGVSIKTNKNIVEAYGYKNEDKSQVFQILFFKDQKSAKNWYNEDTFYYEKSALVSRKGDNYKYLILYDEVYIFVFRVEDIILYAVTTEEHLEDTVSIIKEIGYLPEEFDYKILITDEPLNIEKANEISGISLNISLDELDSYIIEAEEGQEVFNFSYKENSYNLIVKIIPEDYEFNETIETNVLNWIDDNYIYLLTTENEEEIDLIDIKNLLFETEN